jgi:hypothetical protein
LVNVNYSELEDDLISGSFRRDLQDELISGFRQIQQSGERLPSASHYASQIAEIIGRGASSALDADLAFHLYQEILLACEEARASVLGAASLPS